MSDGQPAHSEAAGPRPSYTDGYKRLMLVLLVSAYTLNFVDRTIIATIGQAIKVDLKITDAQLGLLGGLYFALLYTILGLPLARLAERFSRVNIIALAIVIWSGFTTLCGAAGSYLTLSAFRFGVGVGEAGLAPAAHSLISDYFEPKRRASALAIYSFGIPFGAMLGAVLGGVLAQDFSWRVAFMVVGVPGLLVALAIKALIKEPPRGHSEAAQRPEVVDDLAPDAPVRPRTTLGGELKEIGAVIAVLFGTWPVMNMMLGITLVSFAGYGGGQFAPPYFIRAFGLNYAQVGLITGLIAGLSQGVGTLAGGFVTDRLARFSPRWYALTPAIGVALAYPFIVAIYTAASWQAAAAFMLLPGLLSYVYLGPTFGVVQNMVETRQRATATAILFFFLNLIALGGGPPFAGWIIDRFAGFHYAHPSEPGLWQALHGVLTARAPAFAASCPGGAASVGAAAAQVSGCHAALVLATRHGVILTYAFSLWGSLHYLLGSFGLKQALVKASARRAGAPQQD